MSILIPSLLAFISTGITIRAAHKDIDAQVYIFKPLTMGFILCVAWLRLDDDPTLYGYLILGGLLCSLAGDVFLMLPKDRFIQGLVSFLMAHILYILAFGKRVDQPNWIYAIVLLLAGGFILRFLWPGLHRMKIPVLIYVTAILTMVWQALNGLDGPMALHARWATIGAILFMVSDTILAVNRFRNPVHLSQILVLSTYFTAQWMIAWSI